MVLSVSNTVSKPFRIEKQAVWEAWLKVKENKGAPGVDAVSLDEFEEDLKGNLYKIWNRMSSGTYFPPPVRAVPIPKHGGGTRMLGVPTVGDRVAQTVAAMALEGRAEQIFHDDSYGYRPGRGALDAVEVCRRRCWERDWVIDLDFKAFFDSVDHELVLKAVRANTTAEQRWVVLYVTRWLTAPMLMPDGQVQARGRGTPQGSAISPVLANLFLHYAFDMWLARTWPAVWFERYADDAVIHCATERQARRVLASLEARAQEVGLTLHPDKTRIVHCRDDNRRGSHPHDRFDFLGFEFRARTVKSGQGRLFRSFMPAISPKALKRLSAEVRSWRLHRRVGATLRDLAQQINPIVRGWLSYYGRHSPHRLHCLLHRINGYLIRWARNKFRALDAYKRVSRWWDWLTRSYPRAFAHWAWTTGYLWMR